MDFKESLEVLQDYLLDHRNEMTKRYEAAIKEVDTRLAALKNDFRTLKNRNCISMIQSRIKSDASILEKLKLTVQFIALSDRKRRSASSFCVYPFSFRSCATNAPNFCLSISNIAITSKRA